MAREIGVISGATAYIRHPAAGAAASPVQDGRPLDAGTAHIISHNLNVLHRESGRHLLTWLGPGDLPKPTDNGYESLNEDVPPSAQRIGTQAEIAWNLNGNTTAYMDGPFQVARGRHDTTSTYGRDAHLPPRVRWYVSAYSDGAATLKIYVAATGSPSPPRNGYMALNSTTMTSATLTHHELTLTFANAGRYRHPSHSTGYVDAEIYYLWLGFKHAGGATTMGWLSASAFELLDT